MGNRAIITNKEKRVAVYLHWNGGRDSVEAFMSFEVYRRDDDGKLFVVFTSGGEETLFVPTFLKMKRVESEIAWAEEHRDWRRIVSFAWFMDLFHEEVGM